MPYLEMEDGTPIHYVDKGPKSERAVVLIPAEPFSCWCWQRNVEGIARRHRVIAMDVRGRGESGKAGAGHTIEQFARDLQAVLDALLVARFIGVGWSLGGSVVWRYVELFGEGRLAGYVNVDQRPYRFVSEEHLQALQAEIRRDRLAHHLERVRAYLGPEFDKDEGLVRRLAYECLKTPTEAFLGAVNDSYRSDFRPTMGQLSVPTQLYLGRYGVIGPDEGEAMRDAMRAELVTFGSSGHMLPWTEPEKFNSELASFADRVWLRA